MLSFFNLCVVCEYGIFEDNFFRFEVLVFGFDDFFVSIGNYGFNYLFMCNF